LRKAPIRKLFFNELGGNSRSFISANYERLFRLKKRGNIFLTLSTGIGYNPGDSTFMKAQTSIPIALSFLKGWGSNYIEWGAGYTASLGKLYVDSTYSPPAIYKSYEPAYIVRVGYRYMELKHFMVEAAPVFIWTNRYPDKYQWSFGLSLGYAF
jgi:hypothetical protein